MTERDLAQSIASESAILVGVILPNSYTDEEPLSELTRLAETAGVNIVGLLTQNRVKPSSHAYLGKGKVEELRLLAETAEANVVIFDNDLSPAQTRNLEQEMEVKVIDRTELILDIFATHAQTHQSRLAVELAQLEYSLPRLKRMWTHLSRQSMGVGMRGPGEKQLEVDRRLVEKRISDLQSNLDSIHRRRRREVAGRSDLQTVSIVGYTNAGKSTLMNALTNAGVLTEDKLFATLDTRTRRWQLPRWGPVLLSDTVGFIRDLPHRLVESFKATLEEAKQSDLLLHVADASSPSMGHHIHSVFQVLEEIGIEKKNSLLVLNKIDAIEHRSRREAVIERYPNAIPVSALTGEGLDQLATAVGEMLSRSFCNVDIETSIGNGRLMAFLAANGEVVSKEFNDTKVTIHCRLPKKHLGQIKPSEAEIRHRDE